MTRTLGAFACAQEVPFSRKLAAELFSLQYERNLLFEDNTCIALADNGPAGNLRRLLVSGIRW